MIHVTQKPTQPVKPWRWRKCASWSRVRGTPVRGYPPICVLGQSPSSSAVLTAFSSPNVNLNLHITEGEMGMSARDPEPEPAGVSASEDGGDKSTDTKAPLLHQAVARGNVVCVLSLLESKRYSMDELDVVSSSLVIVAAQMGHLAVELLISLEADVGLKNDDESTALHFACFHGHTAIATFLLTKSAVIQGMNNMGTSGYTALHFTAREDHVEIVQLLLDHGANPNTTSDGWYPLHDACVRDDFEIASLLLSRDANVSTAMHDGTSPLHQTVRFLISRSEVDNRTTADVTSLYAAAELGYLDAVKYLATVNTQWRECNTAVHAAAHNGRVAVLRFLIAQGCAMDSPDDKGLTPLCYAVVPGDVDAMNILIAAGANVNMKNHQTSNFTPLHYALEFGQNDALQMMIANGADIHVITPFGHTPLHIAVLYDHVSIASWLLENGAASETRNGENELFIAHLAAMNGQIGILQYLLANKWTKDFERKVNDASPMSMAALADHFDVVQFLIEYQDSNSSGSDSNNEPQLILRTEALASALEGGHLKIMRMLCENGASTDMLATKDTTALHIATAVGSIDIAEYLLEDQHVDLKARASLASLRYCMQRLLVV